MGSYSSLTLCAYLVDEAPLSHPLKIHPKHQIKFPLIPAVYYILFLSVQCWIIYIDICIYIYTSEFVGAYLYLNLFYICVYVRHMHARVCEYISILVMGYERNWIIFIWSRTNDAIFPLQNRLEGSIQHVKNILSNEFQGRMKRTITRYLDSVRSYFYINSHPSGVLLLEKKSPAIVLFLYLREESFLSPVTYPFLLTHSWGEKEKKLGTQKVLNKEMWPKICFNYWASLQTNW